MWDCANNPLVAKKVVEKTTTTAFQCQFDRLKEEKNMIRFINDLM
jgi:hypothetical protein